MFFYFFEGAVLYAQNHVVADGAGACNLRNSEAAALWRASAKLCEGVVQKSFILAVQCLYRVDR